MELSEETRIRRQAGELRVEQLVDEDHLRTWLEIQRDANLRQVRLIDLQHSRGVRRRRGVDRLDGRVRDARLLHQRPGFVQVKGVRLVFGGVVGGIGRSQRQGLGRTNPEQNRFRQALAIDRVIQSLAKQLVACRRRAVLRLRQDQVHRAAVLVVDDLVVRILAQPHRVAQQRQNGDVEAAAFELGGHRLRIGEDADPDAVQIGLAGLPVVRVLLERDVVALDPFDERERTGADRLVLLGRGLWIDQVGPGQDVEQRWPGLGRVKHHGVCVGSLDRLQRGEEVGLDTTVDFTVRLDAVVIPGHVLAAERPAGMPGDARVQVERHLAQVGIGFPAFSQRGVRLERAVQVDQSVEDGIRDVLAVDPVAVQVW